MKCGRERVLLVEDSASVRGALGALLVQEGFRVVGVANAAEALRELADGRRGYDAIVTDFAMPPGPDGVELSHEVRSGGFEGAIVLVSGAFPPDVMERLAQAPVDRCLQKPVARRELVDVMLDVLEKGRGGRARPARALEIADD